MKNTKQKKISKAFSPERRIFRLTAFRRLLQRRSRKKNWPRVKETPKAKGVSVMGLRKEPIKQVKVAFIGLGNRGSGHLKHIAAIHPKAVITAICDIREKRTDHAMEILKKHDQKPAVYTGSEEAWKENAATRRYRPGYHLYALGRSCSHGRLRHAAR